MQRNVLEGMSLPSVQYDDSSSLSSGRIPKRTTVRSNSNKFGWKDKRNYFPSNYPYVQDPYQKNPYGMDIMKASAWANVVFLGVLVITVLVLLLIYTGSKHSVTKVEDSVVILSRSAERAMNTTRDVTRALGDVNITRIIQKSISHDENDWVNATQNAKRSLKSISRIITETDETDSIRKYSHLAQTITGVLTSSKVSQAIEQYSDTAIWAMDWMKSPEAATSVSVIKTSLRRMADTLESPETHQMLDDFLNGEPTKQVLLNSKDFVKQCSTTVQLFNSIVNQIEKEETVKHITGIIKDVKEQGVIEKVVSAYNLMEMWEGKAEGAVSQWAMMVLQWMQNQNKK